MIHTEVKPTRYHPQTLRYLSLHQEEITSRRAREEGYEEEDEEGVEVATPEQRIGNIKGVLQQAIPSNLMATCMPSTCTKEEYMVRVVG